MDLEDAAVIRRDTKVKLHMTAHHAVAWGSLSGLFWGVLTGLLFAFPIAPLFRCSGRHHGRRVRRCGDLGIKDDFKRRVQELVQPGTSALLVIVRQVTVGPVRGSAAALRWQSAAGFAAARHRAGTDEGPARG